MWTRRLVDLPDGEGVDLEIVRDEPWAFCSYLGDLREADRGQRHPADVGHRAARPHAARDVPRPPRGALLQGARARARPWAARGDAGAVPTPQSLVSEGIAKLAPEMLLEGDSGAAPRSSTMPASSSISPTLSPSGEPSSRAGGRMSTRHSCCTRTGWARGGAGVSRALGADDPELAAHVIRFLQADGATSSLTRPDSSLLARTWPASRSASAAC